MDSMERLFEGPLAEQLVAPPETTLRIIGTHTTDGINPVLDFDILIDCSRYMRICSEEYLTNKERVHQKSSGWLHNRLVERDRRRRWTVQKVITARDDEMAKIASNVTRLALGSSYAGFVEFELITSPVEMIDLHDENIAVARVIWELDCSFIVSQGMQFGRGTFSILDSWYDIIVCAMIEGLQRFVSPENPPSLYSQAVLCRDETDNNTYEGVLEGSQGPAMNGYSW